MNLRSKRVIAAVAVIVVILFGYGYTVFNKQSPLSLDDVVDRFHALNDDVISGVQQVGTAEEPGVDPAAPSRGPRSASGDQEASSAEGSTPKTGGVLVISMPAEGVYTYDGTGSEGFGPVRREFPKVSRRIFTREDADTWLEYHIFSEERASWTLLSTTPSRRLVHHQRNYVKIGPYEEDKTLPFVPPIQAALFPPRAGQSWGGEFTGTSNNDEDYTGRYQVKAVDDRVWEVGRVRTRVFGFEINVTFVGEFNGTASVNYWYSTEYGMSVREDYSATASIGPVVYQGEWSVRLRSLTPHT